MGPHLRRRPVRRVPPMERPYADPELAGLSLRSRAGWLRRYSSNQRTTQAEMPVLLVAHFLRRRRRRVAILPPVLSPAPTHLRAAGRPRLHHARARAHAAGRATPADSGRAL